MEGHPGTQGLESIEGATVIFPAAGGPVEEAAREAPSMLGADVTDGAYRVLVGSIPAGYEGPPLHRHPHTDEAFYVAEGELTVVFPEREVVAPPGTLVFIPRGVVHTARNSGSRPMRGTIVISPGDAEHLFEPPEGS
jgi:mannose-6-phosphate isomerase-like protein (cupin superfamily)